MVKIGDVLHGMRIVKSYNGHDYEEPPLFNGFEGYVVWITWDTSDWQVLKTWTENGEFRTKEIGIIDDNLISLDWNDKQVADFIKAEVCKIIKNDMYYEVSVQEVKEQLVNWKIIAPRNEVAIQHVTKKVFNNFVSKITEYINKQINISNSIAVEKMLGIIAIDDIIAKIIQNHEGRTSN